MTYQKRANLEGQEDLGAWAFEKKVPITVIFLLVANLISGIWFASAFYTKQSETIVQFTSHFATMGRRMDVMEQSIYTRQEATIALESIRQTNDRQDNDIKALNSLFTSLLLSRSRNDERK